MVGNHISCMPGVTPVKVKDSPYSRGVGGDAATQCCSILLAR